MARKKKAFPRDAIRTGRAQPHKVLSDELVHIFVDDQNLFYGIVNDIYGPDFRIDFGQLLNVLCKDGSGRARGIRSAYIAGVIPDNDSFWRVAETQGFKVRRGYLGAGRRSKQDDAYLIRDITQTVCEYRDPSTLILVAGDADYVPPLETANQYGWRVEVAFLARGASSSLEHLVHEYRLPDPKSIELMK